MENFYIKFFVVITFLFLNSYSYGYTRSTTIDGSHVLYWTSNCLYWTLTNQSIDNTDQNQPIQTTIPFDQIEAAVKESFKAWDDVSCSYFNFFETATGSCMETGFHNEGGNANRIFWRETGWISSDAPWRIQEQLALTTISYDTNTGEIWDTDIEGNGEYFEWSTSTATPVNDIQNTITHEVGHTIGLDHSTVEDATMFAYAPEGDLSKKTLSQDDIDGICSIYPLAEDPNSCSEPAGGLNLNCDYDNINSGCNIVLSNSCLHSVQWLLINLLIEIIIS